MSLRSRFFSTLALFAAFAAFSALAMAQDTPSPTTPDSTKQQRGFGKHDGFHHGPGGPGMMMGELRGVNLTDAQKEQIHSILEANKPDQGTMDQMKTLMDAKHNGTITPDQEAQLKALHKQAMEKHKTIHDQIIAILTPEQLQQVEQNRKEMKERWEKRQQQPQTPPQQNPGPAGK